MKESFQEMVKKMRAFYKEQPLVALVRVLISHSMAGSHTMTAFAIVSLQAMLSLLKNYDLLQNSSSLD